MASIARNTNGAPVKAKAPKKNSNPITAGFNPNGGKQPTGKGPSAPGGAKGAQQGAAVGSAGIPSLSQANKNVDVSTPPAAAPPPPSFAYYLTGDQQLAFQQAYAGDQATIANFAGNAANLKTQLQLSTQNNLQQASQNIYSNDEDAAARGMFASSIHDGNLADITASAVQNQNSFNVAYNNGITALTTGLQKAQSDERDLINAYNNDAGQNAENLAIANGGTTTPGSFNLQSLVPTTPASTVATQAAPTMQNYSNLPSALTTAANQTGTYSGVSVGTNPSPAVAAAAKPATAPTAAQPATIAGIKTATPSSTGAPTTPVVPK